MSSPTFPMQKTTDIRILNFIPINLITTIRLIKFSVHYSRKKVFKFEKGDIQTQIHVYVLLTIFIYIWKN
jgi:hypothetical protein